MNASTFLFLIAGAGYWYTGTWHNWVLAVLIIAVCTLFNEISAEENAKRDKREQMLWDKLDRMERLIHNPNLSIDDEETN